MKAASAPLIALLDSGVDFASADLWTFTLSGGSILRWSGADKELLWGGNTFSVGPIIVGSRITEKVGLQVANMTVEITAGPGDTVNGVPLLRFIKGHGLDGATVTRERAFMPDWLSPITGTLIRFGGRVTSVYSVEGSKAVINVASWAALLNAKMPADLYQAACRNALYDARCGVTKAAYEMSGAVTGTPSTLAFSSSLSASNGDLALGTVLFTSGANNGVRRTVRTNTGGTVTLVRPLPVAPAAGDTFKAYPGCDRTSARCASRFNNLLRFRGEEFVPQPETSL